MTVTRIILAAGAGSRLGGAVKALLAIGDRPALDRLAALQPPSLGRTIVITGFAADQVETECKRLGLESRRNPNWEQGQTSSLKCGLSMLQDD
ncbi:MAG: NTP transferase domain-containing protein, partial [Planctomycetes bacterium]|nr:NTP transferase domain-containing protein [Planctomycetota bacterium]